MTDNENKDINLDWIMKEMEKLPYPEELFEGCTDEQKELTKSCWSGNIEKFIDSMEKSLGICTKVVDYEKGIMEVSKRKEV